MPSDNTKHVEDSAPSVPNTGKARAPWQRQPDETDRAYAVFRHYLNAGRDRCLADAVKAAKHRNNRTVQGWSAKYRWLERARAYADHQLEKDDALADETREVFIREMVRDRVSLQRKYHRKLADLPKYLHSIAGDAESPPSARVAACRLLIEQAGYAPIEPPKRDDRIDDMVVNEILRLSKVLADVDINRAEAFDRLLDEAIERREQLRQASAGLDDEAD